VESLDRFDLIRIFAIVILGAGGTYLLLPHKHGRTKPRVAHLVGLVLATIATILLASTWRPAGPFVSNVSFFLFGLAAVFGSLLTITSRNPIHSALWFASVVLATSGLFLLSGAQLLAAGTVIVYAGAIIVTFLFVIMLAQMEGLATYDRMARSPFWATLSSYLLFFGLIYALFAFRMGPRGMDVRSADGTPVKLLVPAVDRLGNLKGLTPDQKLILSRALPPTSTLPEATGERKAAGAHVAGLGGTLYTEHLVTVELAGTLLFVALIGALAIATPKPPVRPTSTDASASA
jgi:NADH-quinone oxidoreductase subunit J